jgi:chromosome segregation ATPase
LATIGVVFAVSSGLAPAVLAHGDGETQTTSQAATTLEARLEKKKTELQVRLDSVQQERIKTRCTAAQAKIKVVSGVASTRSDIRDKAYATLLTKLETLTAKLKAKQIDTSVLETQLTELEGKIDAFKDHLSAYTQALQDLQDMDCAADPDAFQAALQGARTERDTAVDEALEIREYVNNTIKETIKSIRQQLSTAESSGNQSSESTDTVN